jgi:Sortilin, neurotensin receptor 3,
LRRLSTRTFLAGFLTIAIVLAFIFLHNRDINPDNDIDKDAGVEEQMTMLWQSRAYPNPDNMEDRYLQAWSYAQTMKLSGAGIRQDLGINGTSGVAGINGNWTSIGPNSGIGGRIISIAVNPVRGNTVFIGSASGGIWKTNNAQATTPLWTPVVTGFPVLGVSSIIINPSDTNTIYAGTGEVYRIDSTTNTANPGNTGYNVWKTRGTFGVGILKSADGGNTWSQVLIKTESNLFGIQKLRFDPLDTSTVYAAATDGLYRSTNAGVTWTSILTKTYVSDVVIDAKNDSEIVAAVGNLENTDKGIYRSANAGATWTKITSGLPTTFRGSIKFDNLSSVGNRDTILASIGVNETGSPNELYISTNFGSTWTAKTKSTHSSYQFWYAHTVSINPFHPDSLAYGGVTLYAYRLAASGSATIGSNVHSDIHDIKYDPSKRGLVYVACDGGVYRSLNGGSSFTAINNGLVAVQFYSTVGVAASATSAALVVGGLQDNGVVKYNGATATWSGFAGLTGTDGAACFVDPTNDKNVLASGDARQVYLSSNTASSAAQKLSYWGEVHDSRTAFVAPLAISKSSPATFYVGTDELFKSTNSGSSWNSTNTSTPGTKYIDALHKTAIAIAVSKTNVNKVYASTSPFAQYDNDADNLYYNPPADVLRTINGASTLPFTQINGSSANPLPNRYILHFAISPTDDDSVWVSVGGFGTAHVYLTPDGGSNWYAKDGGPTGGGLPDVPANAIMIDPNNSSIIYVGNDLGVYVSPDGGTTWQDFNNGFWDATLVMDLEPFPGGQILAATHGKGAFISSLYSNASLMSVTNLTAAKSNDFASLAWNTSIEYKLSDYELQRSMDGKSFSPVTSIGAKNSNNSSYSYQDNVQGLQDFPAIFYRVKINKTDKSYFYSNTVSVNMGLQPSLTIAGNPFSGNRILLKFYAAMQQSSEAILYDAAGKLLARQHYIVQPGVNALSLEIAGFLPRGVYFVEFITPTGKFTGKALKD